MFLVLALLAMTAGTAFAQDATITGTVQNVSVETNESTGETTVLVTYSYVDETGATQEQTVSLSVATAEGLGLASTSTDPVTGLTSTTVNDGVEGSEITIDPATVLPDATTEEDQHPVGSALSDFFSEVIGVDYESIMTYHEDGVGFGVIAQALWLTNEINGDTSDFEALLAAKQSGDYSGITLADGSTPDNWGDVVKSLKKGDNLGSVMSGKGELSEGTSKVTTETSVNEHGKSNNTNNNEHGNGNVNGNGNGNGNSNNNGNKNGNKNGHGHGNGGGRP